MEFLPPVLIDGVVVVKKSGKRGVGKVSRVASDLDTGSAEPSVVLPRVYIAGKMRGVELFNFPAFDAAKELLSEQGWDVVSPADLDRDAGFDPSTLPGDHDWNDIEIEGFSLSEAVNRDLVALQTCDAIYLLRGWETSLGAKAEKALAEWIGVTVLYQESEDVLEEALRITKGDRNATYGPPDQDFRRTAAMWSAIKGVEFEPREVAMFMVALKLSRETHQRKRDNWVDIAGYARCGSICQ